MSWFSSRGAGSGHRPDKDQGPAKDEGSAPVAAAALESHRSLGLASLLEGFAGRPRLQVLDLGPAVGDNVEFLSRFGDAIDDRVAEILDELLDERNATHPHRRLPQILGTLTLILALAASVLLRHSALAAWTIWPATAARTIARCCSNLPWCRPCPPSPCLRMLPPSR